MSQAPGQASSFGGGYGSGGGGWPQARMSPMGVFGGGGGDVNPGGPNRPNGIFPTMPRMPTGDVGMNGGPGNIAPQIGHPFMPVDRPNNIGGFSPQGTPSGAPQTQPGSIGGIQMPTNFGEGGPVGGPIASPMQLHGPQYSGTMGGTGPGGMTTQPGQSPNNIAPFFLNTPSGAPQNNTAMNQNSFGGGNTFQTPNVQPPQEYQPEPGGGSQG